MGTHTIMPSTTAPETTTAQTGAAARSRRYAVATKASGVR